MKFELNRPTDYSDEAFLNEIKRVSTLVDKPLTRTKFSKNSKYATSTIERRFGGWREALNKAGLDGSFQHTDNIKIPSEEIIAELKRISDVYKSKSFDRKQFAEHSEMSIFVFKGDNSFNKLMKLAGLEIPLKSRKYTDDECFENLLNVWTYYGRQPNYAEMKKPPSIVGPKAYILRWGGWRPALIAFLEKVNSDISYTDEPSENLGQIDLIEQPKKKVSKEDIRDIPLGLRFDIFKRDRYRCVICGRSPATHFEIKELQADHIIPFSKNGKTVRENLQTLCNECNNGKSDKF